MSELVLRKYDSKPKVTFFFHDFKSREANPEGFDSKMKNWMHVLEEHVLDRKDPLISIDDLRKQLDTQGMKPTVNCVRLVLTNLLRQEEIVAESQFQQKFSIKKGDVGDSWIGWGISGVRKIFTWGSSIPNGKQNPST
jgi:hypothetical protein